MTGRRFPDAHASTCRCDLCKADRAAYQREYRSKKLDSTLDPDNGKHGTTSNYTMGCRCEACSAARRAYAALRVSEGVKDSQHGTASGYTTGCRCEACRTAIWVYGLGYKYGLTADAYAALWAAQGEACGACGTTERGTKHAWHVDHDHATGVVRGILCHGCNVAFGQLGESVDKIAGLLRYAFKFGL